MSPKRELYLHKRARQCIYPQSKAHLAMKLMWSKFNAGHAQALKETGQRLRAAVDANDHIHQKLFKPIQFYDNLFLKKLPNDNIVRRKSLRNEPEASNSVTDQHTLNKRTRYFGGKVIKARNIVRRGLGWNEIVENIADSRTNEDDFDLREVNFTKHIDNFHDSVADKSNIDANDEILDENSADTFKYQTINKHEENKSELNFFVNDDVTAIENYTTFIEPLVEEIINNLTLETCETEQSVEEPKLVITEGLLCDHILYTKPISNVKLAHNEIESSLVSNSPITNEDETINMHNVYNLEICKRGKTMVENEKTVEHPMIRKVETIERPVKRKVETIERPVIRKEGIVEHPVMRKEQTVEQPMISNEDSAEQPIIRNKNTVEYLIVGKEGTVEHPIMRDENIVEYPILSNEGTVEHPIMRDENIVEYPILSNEGTVEHPIMRDENIVEYPILSNEGTVEHPIISSEETESDYECNVFISKQEKGENFENDTTNGEFTEDESFVEETENEQSFKKTCKKFKVDNHNDSDGEPSGLNSLAITSVRTVPPDFSDQDENSYNGVEVPYDNTSQASDLPVDGDFENLPFPMSKEEYYDYGSSTDDSDFESNNHASDEDMANLPSSSGYGGSSANPSGDIKYSSFLEASRNKNILVKNEYRGDEGSATVKNPKEEASEFNENAAFSCPELEEFLREELDVEIIENPNVDNAEEKRLEDNSIKENELDCSDSNNIETETNVKRRKKRRPHYNDPYPINKPGRKKKILSCSRAEGQVSSTEASVLPKKKIRKKKKTVAELPLDYQLPAHHRIPVSHISFSPMKTRKRKIEESNSSQVEINENSQSELSSQMDTNEMLEESSLPQTDDLEKNSSDLSVDVESTVSVVIANSGENENNLQIDSQMRTRKKKITIPDILLHRNQKPRKVKMADNVSKLKVRNAWKRTLKLRPSVLNVKKCSVGIRSQGKVIQLRSGFFFSSNVTPNLILMKTWRKIGLVVYPGPNLPLAPTARKHLDDIRKDNCFIDQNWASFAASALPGYLATRKIIPVKVQMKLSSNEPVINNFKKSYFYRNFQDTDVSDIDDGVRETLDNVIGNVEKILDPPMPVKNVSVVMNPVKLKKTLPYCLFHQKYLCTKCGLERRLRLTNVKPAEKAFIEKGLHIKPVQPTNTIIKLNSESNQVENVSGQQLNDDQKVYSKMCMRFRQFFSTKLQLIPAKKLREYFIFDIINVFFDYDEIFISLKTDRQPIYHNMVNIKMRSYMRQMVKRIFYRDYTQTQHCVLKPINGLWRCTIDNEFEKRLKENTLLIKNSLACLYSGNVQNKLPLGYKWLLLPLNRAFDLILLPGHFGIRKASLKKKFGSISHFKEAINEDFGAHEIPDCPEFICIGPYKENETHSVFMLRGKDVIPLYSRLVYGKHQLTTPIEKLIKRCTNHLMAGNYTIEAMWLHTINPQRAKIEIHYQPAQERVARSRIDALVSDAPGLGYVMILHNKKGCFLNGDYSKPIADLNHLNDYVLEEYRDLPISWCAYPPGTIMAMESFKKEKSIPILASLHRSLNPSRTSGGMSVLKRRCNSCSSESSTSSQSNLPKIMKQQDFVKPVEAQVTVVKPKKAIENVHGSSALISPNYPKPTEGQFIAVQTRKEISIKIGENSSISNALISPSFSKPTDQICFEHSYSSPDENTVKNNSKSKANKDSNPTGKKEYIYRNLNDEFDKLLAEDKARTQSKKSTNFDNLLAEELARINRKGSTEEGKIKIPTTSISVPMKTNHSVLRTSETNKNAVNHEEYVTEIEVESTAVEREMPKMAVDTKLLQIPNLTSRLIARLFDDAAQKKSNPNKDGLSFLKIVDVVGNETLNENIFAEENEISIGNTSSVQDIEESAEPTKEDQSNHPYELVMDIATEGFLETNIESNVQSYEEYCENNEDAVGLIKIVDVSGSAGALSMNPEKDSEVLDEYEYLRYPISSQDDSNSNTELKQNSSDENEELSCKIPKNKNQLSPIEGYLAKAFKRPFLGKSVLKENLGIQETKSQSKVVEKELKTSLAPKKVFLTEPDLEYFYKHNKLPIQCNDASTSKSDSQQSPESKNLIEKIVEEYYETSESDDEMNERFETKGNCAGRTHKEVNPTPSILKVMPSLQPISTKPIKLSTDKFLKAISATRRPLILEHQKVRASKTSEMMLPHIDGDLPKLKTTKIVTTAYEGHKTMNKILDNESTASKKRNPGNDLGTSQNNTTTVQKCSGINEDVPQLKAAKIVTSMRTAYEGHETMTTIQDNESTASKIRNPGSDLGTRENNALIVQKSTGMIVQKCSGNIFRFDQDKKCYVKVGNQQKLVGGLICKNSEVVPKFKLGRSCMVVKRFDQELQRDKETPPIKLSEATKNKIKIGSLENADLNDGIDDNPILRIKIVNVTSQQDESSKGKQKEKIGLDSFLQGTERNVSSVSNVLQSNDDLSKNEERVPSQCTIAQNDDYSEMEDEPDYLDADDGHGLPTEEHLRSKREVEKVEAVSLSCLPTDEHLESEREVEAIPLHCLPTEEHLESEREVEAIPLHCLPTDEHLESEREVEAVPSLSNDNLDVVNQTPPLLVINENFLLEHEVKKMKPNVKNAENELHVSASSSEIHKEGNLTTNMSENKGISMLLLAAGELAGHFNNQNLSRVQIIDERNFTNVRDHAAEHDQSKSPTSELQIKTTMSEKNDTCEGTDSVKHNKALDNKGNVKNELGLTIPAAEHGESKTFTVVQEIKTSQSEKNIPVGDTYKGTDKQNISHVQIINIEQNLRSEFVKTLVEHGLSGYESVDSIKKNPNIIDNEQNLTTEMIPAEQGIETSTVELQMKTSNTEKSVIPENETCERTYSIKEIINETEKSPMEFRQNLFVVQPVGPQTSVKPELSACEITKDKPDGGKASEVNTKEISKEGSTSGSAERGTSKNTTLELQKVSKNEDVVRETYSGEASSASLVKRKRRIKHTPRRSELAKSNKTETNVPPNK